MSRGSHYKLRQDLTIQRRVFGDDVKYVVKDPDRLEYFTIDQVSYTLLSLCDGKRDVSELTEVAQQLLPGMDLDAMALLSFYENYKKAHFFEDPWERNVLLIEKRRKSRSQVLKKATANPLEIHFPAWDPDRFFDRVVPRMGALFTGKALLVYTLIFIAAISISLTHARDFALPLGELYVIQGKTLLGLVVLWCILLFTVVLHEFGHGMTCKHYGGEVHKIGFLFLYFNPCLFCDVTESYFFESKKKKQLVTLAGGVVDLMVASVATFIWFFTAHDLFVSEVAHRIAIFSGVSGIAINFNPLMKYDGYFVLSDHLNMPNLRGDAFQFLGNRIRSLFGLPHGAEFHSSRERRIFWIYGLLGLLYSVFVLWFVLMFVSNFLVGHFRAAGYLVSLGLVLLMTRKYIMGLFRFGRFFAVDKAAHFRRHRWLYLAGTGLFLILLLLVPLPRHVRGEFILRPGEEAVVRAGEAGVIESVFVKEGEAVQSGTALLTMRADGVRLARQQAATVREVAEVKQAAAIYAEDAGAARIHETEAITGAALERHYAERIDQLRPTSPIDGVILTPRLRERIGMACARGDTLCEIGDLLTLRAEILVDELDLGVLEHGEPVELRMSADPGRLRSGRIETISLEHTDGRVRHLYRVVVRVENDDGSLRPGMSGRARLAAGRVAVIEHMMGRIARVVRINFWI